jgi:Sec-independent protein translocase protein TatA
VSIGLFQILVIALVLLLLFGRSRIGEGVNRLGEGHSEDEAASLAAHADNPQAELVADSDQPAG